MDAWVNSRIKSAGAHDKAESSIYVRSSHKYSSEMGENGGACMHGDDLIVFFRINGICQTQSVLSYSFVRVRSEGVIHAFALRCDAIRVRVRLRRQPSDGVALSEGRSAGERSSRIPDEDGSSSAGGAVAVDCNGARTRENAAREVPAAPANRRTRHRGSRLRKGDAKFSCLQPIEKAQNVEIFSTAEDGLGATKRGRGGSSLAAGFACARGAAIARGAP